MIQCRSRCNSWRCQRTHYDSDQRYNLLHCRETCYTMKQFIISLLILCAYMLVDTLLTAWGLRLGLRESNPFVTTDNLFGFYIAMSAYVVLNASAAYFLARYLKIKYVARLTVLSLTIFYVYVLSNNISLIWRLVRYYR